MCSYYSRLDTRQFLIFFSNTNPYTLLFTGYFLGTFYLAKKSTNSEFNVMPKEAAEIGDPNRVITIDYKLTLHGHNFVLYYKLTF